MPSFECRVCGAAFEVPSKSLEKYPNWKPRYCREHSPRKSSRAAPNERSRGARAGGERNPTLAAVLAVYRDGPADGVFTDGSAVPNPGRGGWGVVRVAAGEVIEQRHGSAQSTTNNRMELQALIEAFKLLPGDAREIVYTDSRLCVDTITKWAAGWERRGWKRKGGEIKNLELVRELYALHRSHPHCELRWIEAHAGNRWNEYADSLATAWMREEL